MKKVLQFLIAFLGEGVSLDESRKRLNVCMGCEHLKKENGLYCGACGCPQWRYSELTRKTRMLEATCPVGKW